jgi:hypothetical protein
MKEEKELWKEGGRDKDGKRELSLCVVLNGGERIEDVLQTSFTLVRGFDSRRRLGIFLFSTASRTAMGTTQAPIQWASGGSFPEGKAAGT